MNRRSRGQLQGPDVPDAADPPGRTQRAPHRLQEGQWSCLLHAIDQLHCVQKNITKAGNEHCWELNKFCQMLVLFPVLPLIQFPPHLSQLNIFFTYTHTH